MIQNLSTTLGNRTMIKFFKLFSPRLVFRRSCNGFSCFQNQTRFFADTPSSDVTQASKQIVVQGTENEERVRVRRARPADVPRVLRFVREHAHAAWPGLVAPAPRAAAASHLVLADYVARALAQGHSMVAEQHEARRGWLQVRGLALCAAACPWDAALTERWARCVRCARARRLLNFSAHCLRAPRLHDKYRVHNILQVKLIVPPDSPKSSEIVQVLAKNAIQRARDVGFPLLRFDVTREDVAQSLEAMELKKEWHQQYDYSLPEGTLKEGEGAAPVAPADEGKRKLFVAVYSALAHPEK